MGKLVFLMNVSLDGYPVEWCAFDGDHTPNPHDTGQSTSWNPPQVWAFISQF